MITRKHYPFAAFAAAGLLGLTFSLGHLSVSHAQDSSNNAPTAEKGAPPPPALKDGKPPGPRGEHPPQPPGLDADQPPAPPVDPQAATTAVKTASDALASLTTGQVWTHTAPRGEQQVQATLLFQGKEAARLEFDPANGSLLTRGQHLPPPPVGPRGPLNGPDAKAATPAADATKSATAPAAPVNLDPIKAKLADIAKGLSVGQGAEIMPREGFWKVPLIFQNRVVGELRLSGDGTKVMQDFAAARDAAVFAK